MEDSDPEEANSYGSYTSNGAAEEKQYEQGHEDVVDGKDSGGLDEDPIQGLENVDFAEDVTAALFADRVFGLVDAGDEH